MNQSLLIELGTEDLPARYVRTLAHALRNGMEASFAQRGIRAGPPSAGTIPSKAFATPRRIAVLFDGVATKQDDRQIRKLGPKVESAFKDGLPTPAALGFAKSCGVEVQELGRENGYLVFNRKQKGRKTIELIPEAFAEAVKHMDELVPKRMRWGSREETFVRPVHWIVVLYGGRVVPLERFGLKAGRKTYGHRFHAPKAIRLKSPSDYEAVLREAKVWADFTSRKAEIKRQVEEQAAKLQGKAPISEALLDEVTALVEWPVAISGRIEERFLQLPPEVVVATVETNQRYFTLFDAQGKLLPHFITVANIESKDVAQVIAGNERVVRPRLTDALFFWNHDLNTWIRDSKKGFLQMSELLISTPWGQQAKSTTYAKGLGTFDDRLSRVQLVAGEICNSLQISDHVVQVAAVYAKVDLFSKMVYEFPELQGVMGSYYAKMCGMTEAVATAIREQYLPSSANSPIPVSEGGRVLALADKLDALAGMFAIGQKPTASKDPFALRRAALGVLRIAVEGELNLDLRATLLSALNFQPDSSAIRRDQSVLNELWEFVIDRFRGYCLERGASAEQFEAVKAVGVTRPLNFVRRLDALRKFQHTPAAATLAAADKRARNILRQSGGQAAAAVQTGLFEVQSEHDLLAELERVESALAPLRVQAEYGAMLQALSSLKEPVDAFFDGVMVMADKPEVRGNRLALLARLDALCREVADLSCLPG